MKKTQRVNSKNPVKFYVDTIFIHHETLDNALNELINLQESCLLNDDICKVHEFVIDLLEFLNDFNDDEEGEEDKVTKIILDN